ncbi:MAG: TadE/TadG family type IV pilus assembly protein [Acidobacteriota bacterium]|nr:pilus assembly protein [Blastocatellia bacterium]MDW8241293.1 TadE/TadG family type IV pilus assembly protein [Acidobacteriota bacterium]
MMSLHRRGDINTESRRPQAQRGQTLVEFAMAAPILVIMLVGIVDFGRVLMVQHSITNAARQSARLATMTNSAESVYSKINASLASGGLSSDAVTISVTGLTGRSGEPTQVTISYRLTPLILRLLHIDQTVTLSAASRMRRE